MNSAYALWRSTRGDDRLAAEISCGRPQRQCLPSLTKEVLDGQPCVGFLFVRVEEVTGLDSGAIKGSLQLLERRDSARLCLAGKRAALTTIASSVLNSDHVGLMLNDVDAETPLSDLLWDRIEAVQFKSEFVMHARRDVRQGCALESMLSLCRELGLCTLGVGAVAANENAAWRTEFDYVPALRGQP